jgi:glutamyl-tRNA synthetase
MMQSADSTVPRGAGVRVRFAPSPTGYLHVGGARTALFNWLFARGCGGALVLRVEDTDRARSSDAMTEAIVEGLTWLGIDWDEGPVHQADGLDRHRAGAHTLIEAEHAYRCFCTPADIETRRSADHGESFRYDRHCLDTIDRAESDRRARAGDPFVVRFRVPAGTTAWDDVVHGPMEFDNRDIEDFIVLRTDGTPIYNLAVVSDDIEMRITHVIRGDDHISNTPKQILIYRALGAVIPDFAHVPMILGEDGKRLSKRHGATSVGEYRTAGILPQAMVNFLALLGWSPGNDDEVLMRRELVDRFSLEAVNRKSAVFDTRKLEWLNGQHPNAMTPAELVPLVADALSREGIDGTDAMRDDARFAHVVDLLKGRARGVDDIAQWIVAYFSDDFAYDAAAVEKHWREPADVAQRLATLRETLAESGQWSEPELERMLRSHAERHGTGAGRLIHPLRVALLGQAVSPGIFEVLVALGRERSLARIDNAVHTLRTMAANG